MRRVALMIFLAIILPLSSCAPRGGAREMLEAFLDSYGAETEVYSTDRMSHEEGYVSEGLLEKMMMSEGPFPEDIALAINQRAERGFEAALFICRDADEISAVTEMCDRRLSLLTEGVGGGLLLRSGKVVFYTTAEDRDRAEALFTKIMRSFY